MDISVNDELDKFDADDALQFAEFHLEALKRNAVNGLEITLALIEARGNIDLDPESPDASPTHFDPESCDRSVSAVDRVSRLVCKVVKLSEAIALLNGMRTR